MTFDEFIKKLPELRRARTQSDGKRILAFLEKNSSSQNRFTLFYDRSPDFFSLLKLSSPDFFVIYYETASGEIEGVISYTLLRGKTRDSLYVGDLKIKTNSEEMKAKWREFANDFIENLHSIDEFREVEDVHMVMMDDNTRAYQRLVASNLVNFKYQKAFAYKMINILGVKWWRRKRSSSVAVSIENADPYALEGLMNEFSEERQLAGHPELIAHRAREMTPFAKILEVKDPAGLVLLRASLEDVSPVKRIILKRLPRKLKLLTQALRLFGGRPYQEGKPLEILYMSHICFHPSVSNQGLLLADAVSSVQKEFSGKYHMIALSFFEREAMLVRDLERDFLIQIEPLGFYQIRPDWGKSLDQVYLPYFNLSYI